MDMVNVAVSTLVAGPGIDGLGLTLRSFRERHTAVKGLSERVKTFCVVCGFGLSGDRVGTLRTPPRQRRGPHDPWGDGPSPPGEGGGAALLSWGLGTTSWVTQIGYQCLSTKIDFSLKPFWKFS